MELLNVTVFARGITPLLMNRVTEETLLGLRDKTKKAKNAPRPEDPREEAEPKVHRLADGRPHLPIGALFASLVEAGKYVRLDGKRQVSTASSTILPAFMSIESKTLPLVNHLDKKGAAWEVDMQPGKNPNGGELVCIVRPRFDVWAFEANILIDTKEISENQIRTLWDYAGRRVGLLDFRPQRKGTYGQFVVDRWEVQRAKKAA